MKKAWLRVNPELLLEILHLPVGTSIEDAKWDGNDILFLVDSPDLEEIAMGVFPPEVSAIFHRQEPVIFVTWEYKT